jgi:hypothetical protein
MWVLVRRTKQSVHYRISKMNDKSIYSKCCWHIFRHQQSPCCKPHTLTRLAREATSNDPATARAPTRGAASLNESTIEDIALYCYAVIMALILVSTGDEWKANARRLLLFLNRRVVVMMMRKIFIWCVVNGRSRSRVDDALATCVT